MAKFGVADKLKLTLFVVLVQAAPVCFAADSVDDAKTLLMQGRRADAMAMIDRLKAKTRKKNEIDALASRKKLFFSQFLVSESFQKNQEAILLSEDDRWVECLKELDGVLPGDRDNKLVLETRAICERGSGAYDKAQKTLTQILDLDPADPATLISMAELHLASKKYELGLTVLQGVQTSDLELIERLTVVKAKLFVALDRAPEALVILREDQEKYLEHIRVIFELGTLYAARPNSDWLARKYLSLFVSRCKRMKSSEIEKRDLTKECQQSGDQLATMEKKLAI